MTGFRDVRCRDVAVRLVWALAGTFLYGVFPQASLSAAIKLQPPDTSSACFCHLLGTSRQNPSEDMCLRGVRTTCEKCPQQRRCAQITAIVGDGVRGLQQQCGIGSDAALCSKAVSASLSYPSSIALDDLDNLYIADNGNNVIHMLQAGAQDLVKIAGTGESGFSGDGRLAVNALLRRPESLAVKPGVTLTAKGYGREVYFSDYLNQRVRRLESRSNGWYITTVAGNGKIGRGNSCDSGCDALAVALNYPRALAFSSSQDLYIADSGSWKIRKLNPGGIVSTFVGAHGRSYKSPSPQNEQGLGSSFLPGSWEQPNEYVAIAELYSLAIDSDDNLWFLDTKTNKILMSPLKDASISTSNSGEANVYAENYVRVFGGSRKQVLDGLAAWLPAVWPTWKASVLVSQETSRFQKGRTYWMYAKPVVGDWCAGGEEACSNHEPVAAQFAQFRSVRGLCFDEASDIYLAEAGSSQLLSISRRNRADHGRLEDAEGYRLTSRGCRCLRYWYDGSQSICPPEVGECRDMCRENPEALQRLQNDATFRIATKFMNIDDLPHCATTSYCAAFGADGVEGCYVDRTSSPENSCSGSEQAFEFCGFVEAEAVSFLPVPSATVLGHEIRMERFVEATSTSELTQVAKSVSQDLWQVPYGSSILIGFLDPSSCCPNTCCGMDTFLLSNGLQACQLVDFASLETVMANMVFDGTKSINLVYHDADVLQGSRIESPSVHDCQDWCKARADCSSFMEYKMSVSSSSTSLPKCVFFTANAPYYVYPIDRSDFDETLVPNLRQSELGAYRNQFGRAISPPSRLFDAKGLYVADSSRHARDMVSNSKPEAALLLQECQDACLANSKCWSIAYPGCYLLSESATQLALQYETRLNRGSVLAEQVVYIKSYIDETVVDVAGSPQVYSPSSNGIASEAYLNRPSGNCAVDSDGSVLFADVWNNQVRKITGFNVDCLHSYIDQNRHAVKAEVITSYMHAIGNAADACDDPATEAALDSAVRVRDVDSVLQNVCKYSNGPSDAASLQFYSDFTDNKLVLCQVCGNELLPRRPTVCPPLAHCKCQASLLNILETQIYKECRASSSNRDPWHILATSYATCLWAMSPDADWLKSKRSTLDSKLLNIA